MYNLSKPMQYETLMRKMLLSFSFFNFLQSILNKFTFFLEIFAIIVFATT